MGNERYALIHKSSVSFEPTVPSEQLKAKII